MDPGLTCVALSWFRPLNDAWLAQPLLAAPERLLSWTVRTAVEHRPCLFGFIHIPCISKEMGLQHIKYLQLPEKRQHTALKGDKNIALKYLQWTHHIPSGSSLGSGVLGLWSLYCIFSQVPLEFWRCVIVPRGCVWRKWLYRWGSFGELDTCAPKQDGVSYRVDISLGLCQVYAWTCLEQHLEKRNSKVLNPH